MKVKEASKQRARSFYSIRTCRLCNPCSFVSPAGYRRVLPSAIVLKMIQAPPAVHNIEMFVNRKTMRHFECIICTNAQKDPVMCREGHGYCRACIEQWKLQSAKCPSCNKALDIIVPNRDAGRMIDESLVYCYTRVPGLAGEGGAAAFEDEDEVSSSSCSRSSAGEKRKKGSSAAAKKGKARIDHCTWTGKLQDADSHFGECDYAGVVCCFVGCGSVVMRRDQTEHEADCEYRTIKCKWGGCNVRTRVGAALKQHQLNCLKRAVTCPNAACGEKMAFLRVSAHRAGACEYEVVACPFAAHGCAARMLRKDSEEHERRTSAGDTTACCCAVWLSSGSSPTNISKPSTNSSN